MKLRIKGNSLRLRLSKTDVQTLFETGRVTDKISFGTEQLLYTLKSAESVHTLEASFNMNNIVILIPDYFVQDWYGNNIVGIDSTQTTGKDQSLFILVEKDFQCLDETTEDQSDNYINPNSVC